MTALSKYQRLEAAGLWRPSQDAQRCEVIVSIGDATLTISDTRDQALAHWSLPAITRANAGRYPAIYHPDGDPAETLELPENEKEFITSIEKLRRAIDRRRPHPGRLRLTMFLLSLAAVAALLVFWLPGAVRNHALRVVPEVKRMEIGQSLLTRLERVTGPACHAGQGAAALAQLAARLPAPNGPNRLIVVRNGVRDAIHLTGDTILLDRKLVEDFEEPDVIAGYIIAEQTLANQQDPLGRLLRHAGLWASLKLLATGALDGEILQSYAEYLLTGPRLAVTDEALLKGFYVQKVRSTPYAYARDMSGEATLALIEADPYAHSPPQPVLSDANWLRLQGICGG